MLPAYPPDTDLSTVSVPGSMNQGQPISHLVSAPTMRVPSNVSMTPNAYLAFRAVLRTGECVCVYLLGYISSGILSSSQSYPYIQC